MKYYKKDNEVFAFEDDGSQDEYITQDMVRMTSSDVDKHLNPKKYMTDEQLYEIYVKSLRPLTRRQFRLALLDVGLLDDLETLKKLDSFILFGIRTGAIIQKAGFKLTGLQ